jgi:predicted nucleic acid-binding protein
MTQLAIDASVIVAFALDTDEFHGESARFLDRVIDRRVRLVSPGLLLIESACAIARRTGSESLARAATATLLKHERLLLDTPESTERLMETIDIGLRTGLKGADAIYAATAERHEVPLVSWDRELLARAGAITPTDWMARRA